MVFWRWGPRLPRQAELAALPSVLPPAAPGEDRGYLDSVLSESTAVLDTDLSTYEQLTSQPGWSVHCRPVEGSKLTLVRLEAELPQSADTLFNFLISMEGKRIIDPFPKEHHSEHVQTLRPTKSSSGSVDAQVVYSEAPRFAGMLRPREYVTCDAAVPSQRLFVCKSCRVKDGPLMAAAKGRVRANLLFAMRLHELEGRRGCRLQMINWLDLGANTVPTELANLITERWYFQGVMRRLKRHLASWGGGEGGSLACQQGERQG